MMKDLLLLHGAIGAKDQLQPLTQKLSDRYNIHSINFSGHGGRAFSETSFSIELFADNVLEYLWKHKIDQLAVFGYSMGGYVAMWLAKHYPDKIEKVITFATKFHWDEATAAREVKMLDADAIAAKLPVFAEELRGRHSPNDWKEVLHKTRQLLLSLGKKNTLQVKDYSSIEVPCLLLLGDKDKMITKEEAAQISGQIPNAQFELLPDTPHPLGQVDIPLLARRITAFLP